MNEYVYYKANNYIYILNLFDLKDTVVTLFFVCLMRIKTCVFLDNNLVMAFA